MAKSKPILSSRKKFLRGVALGSILGLNLSPLLSFGISQSSVTSKEQDQWWLELGNEFFGAKPDEQGVIGGGTQYAHVVKHGDFIVRNLDELQQALKKAKLGNVIFLPGDVHIDLTTYVYIEKLVLEIPAGVTLASDRGYKGSKGALFTSDSLDTPVLFKTQGPGVRFSGLRIQGPNPKRYLEHHKESFSKGGKGRNYYYKFPVSRGIITEFGELEIDNCEISAFSSSGIFLKKGYGHHIHHNFIHKCQYNGLGYGISHDRATSIIEFNLFNENRHSLAGTGNLGCGYIARNNIELGVSLSHCFDMHGGQDRKDGTNIAGSRIEIYNNTFMPAMNCVRVRGVPEDVCLVYNNWFVHQLDPAKAVMGYDRTKSYNNLYGENPQKAT